MRGERALLTHPNIAMLVHPLYRKVAVAQHIIYYGGATINCSLKY